MEFVPTSLVGATAKQIARAVRRGDTTATQVVADHLEQIAISDPELHAFRVVRGGEAMTEAEKVDDQEDLANLPLAGVPVAVKENTAVAGLPTWNGSEAARTAVAEEDHEVVRRLRGAGAVIVGVTRMPEMGLWAVTDGAGRGDPQPVGPRPHPGRLVRRRGGRGGGRPGADGPVQRRTRLDPDPGGLLRPGRPQARAAVWCPASWARRLVRAGRARRADHHGGGRGGRLRGAGRPPAGEADRAGPAARGRLAADPRSPGYARTSRTGPRWRPPRNCWSAPGTTRSPRSRATPRRSAPR